jgi:hypothetical protein
MLKRLLVLFALCQAGLAAQAQVRFSAGPQLGYSLATSTYKFQAFATYDTQYRSGVVGGVTGELGLGHVFVRPAVLYVQKGYNQEETRFNSSQVTTSRVRLDYLTVPLHLGFAQHRDGQGVQVFAGPYFGLLLGGHYTRSTSSPSTSTRTASGGGIWENNVSDTNTSDEPYRAIDFGLQGGVGYRHQQLLAQLEYSAGFLNADFQRGGPSAFYGSTAYLNRGFQLALAYLFALKS